MLPTVSKPLLNNRPRFGGVAPVTIIKNTCLILLPLVILANFFYWSPDVGKKVVGANRNLLMKPKEKKIYPWRTDCAMTYTFNFTDTWGLTSELNHLFLAAAYARWANRTFLIDGRKWNYGNYYELFENVLPDCGNLGELLPNSTHRPEIDNQHQHIESVRYWDGLWQWLSDRSEDTLSLAYIRDCAKLLFKPSKRVQDIADHYTATIAPFKGKYYSIHARRGDKVYEGAKIRDLEEYMQKVEALILRFEDRVVDKDTPDITVFVASDDLEAAVKLAKEARPKWNIIHIATNHTHGNGHMQWTFNHLPFEKKVKEVGHLVSELEMIRNAEGCVCTYSSNVCTFIQFIRHGHPRSVISLDRQMYTWLKLPEIHQDPFNI